MDTKAVSRAVSSLIDDDRIKTTDESTVVGLRSRGTIKCSNKLRDLAAGNVDSQSLATSTTTNTVDNDNNN